MNKLKFPLLLTSAILVALPLLAQPKRVSPHETISMVIDNNRVTLVYGRPYSKDPRSGAPRKIWGGLVPWGKVWRTGADEATLLVTQKAIELGGTEIPAGAYTLWTLPNEDGTAKLIVSKQIGQWGTQYNDQQDLARVDLKKETLEKPVDQFTMALARNSSGGGLIKMMWEDTQFSVPFIIRSTASAALVPAAKP